MLVARSKIENALAAAPPGSREIYEFLESGVLIRRLPLDGGFRA